MQLLAELGFPGLLLWLAFVAATLVHAGLLRFRAPPRSEGAVLAAMMTAVISWFIHSSADWLWQLAAVSAPAIMLLGGLVGAGGSRGGEVPVAADGAAAGAARPRRARQGAHFPRANLWRVAGTLLALLIIASAAFPYLSLKYTSSASAAGPGNLETAVARTRTAAWLDPTSLAPFAIRAGLYEAALRLAPPGSAEAVNLQESVAATWKEAAANQPSSWVASYYAGASLVALRDATPEPDPAAAEDLTESARTYLNEARRLNPLSPEVAGLAKTLDNRAPLH
jgi:hypothetical protein